MLLNEFKWDLQMFATPVQPVEGTFGTDATGNVFYYSESDRANEENFGPLLEPGLRKTFFETYDELPEQFSMIYNVMNSNKATETDWGMGDFGDWEIRTSQVDTVAYDTLSPGLKRTYVHDAFTKGFKVTREMNADDQYGQMDKLSKAMARAGRAKVEKDAMLPLINGFTAGASAIYDGKALFANDHPLLDSSGVGSNLATGALADASLKDAIKLMRETVGEAGNLVQFKPDRLIIAPDNEDNAMRLLHSSQITGSANNDTNEYLKGRGMSIVVMDYLGTIAGGSDDAWFLQDSMRHELNFFWREKPSFSLGEDYDTFVANYIGYMRYSYGISDWRGLVGSTGVVA